MLALGMAGFVVGLIIGRRFTAFALLPLDGLALLMAMLAAASGHVGWSAAAFGFLSFWLASQTSFVVALTIPAPRRRHPRTVA